MTKPTNEELQKELEEVVTKHNQALEYISKCKTRATEISAILKDRKEVEDPTPVIDPIAQFSKVTRFKIRDK